MTAKPKKSADARAKHELQEEEVAGHHVQYERTGEVETVLIDGEPQSFFQVGDRYLMELNAYGEPRPTLIEAAAEYAKTLPSPDEEA